MMATVPQVTSGLGLRKFQADGFLFDRVYIFVLTTYQPENGVKYGLKCTDFHDTQ